MNNSYLDPIYLPIAPPMDLNSPGSDDISAFPLQLRAYGGAFRAVRGTSGHEGVDLLAPLGTPVFAVSQGLVTDVADRAVIILHNRGFEFVAYYQHLQNISVDVGPVEAGQQIGEVGVYDPSHLHFEIRYPNEPTAIQTRLNSLPVDPTNALYRLEVRAFRHNPAIREGRFYDNVHIDLLEEVSRAGTLRFLLVKVCGENTRDLYVPLIDSSPANLSLIETLKLAFFHSRRVKLVWRESLFFSEIQNETDRTAIIAEVSVLG